MNEVPAAPLAVIYHQKKKKKKKLARKAKEILCFKIHAVRTAATHYNQDFNTMETPRSVVPITYHLHFIKILLQ